MNDLEFGIAKLNLAIGDILVMKVNARLMPQQVEAIKQSVKDSVPDGVKVLVIDKNINLTVLSFDEIQKLISK